MRKCSKCKQIKNELEFHFRPNGKLYYQCKSCCREYTRSHYKKNKKYYIDKAKRNTDNIKTWFFDYKSKKECEVCGENHIATLDFHHIDPIKKEDCISIIMSGGSLRKLKEELKKCKVFCANCHRKFHYKDPVAQLD